MEPLVSVVTAAYEPDPEHVAAAYLSLRAQAGPAWEWLLQYDGEEVAHLPPGVAGDRRVAVGCNPTRLGAPATRNRALARARGPLVQSLDADDLLLPGALASLAAALQEPEVAFAFGGTAVMDGDGCVETSPYPWFEPGTVPPGEIERAWERAGVPPVCGGAAMWRRDFLLAYGGWAALAGGEDTAVIVAAGARHPSVYVGRDVLVRRRHPGQISATRAYRDGRRLEWRFARERARALRALGERAPGGP